MKISVQLGVSENESHESFDLEDLGYSEAKWELLSNKQKMDIIKEGVFDLSNQPYWMIKSFKEEN